MIETENGSLLADPQVYAELAAFSDEGSSFDPSIVTDALGLSPTTTRQVGDRLPRGRSSRHAWWTLIAFPQQVAFYADDVVTAALAPLVGKEDAVAALQLRGVSFQLALVVQTQIAVDSAGDPTVHEMYLGLSADSVARLASLSFAYSIDQQFWPAALRGPGD